MKTSSFTLLALCGALGNAILPAHSQNALPDARQNAAPSAVAAGVPLAALLQLQPAQTERLTRLYRDFTTRRLAGEAKIARLPASPAGQAQNLAARRKIAADWQATRAKARQVLPPVQRSQLDSLASDPRFRVRPDEMFQLLLAPAADFDAPFRAAPQDPQARRDWLEARRLAGQSDLNRAQKLGSYGVYGGYGYGGPQAGVYGGYQQGAVGVHAGVGTSGPSVGISIGRVFGVGRR